MQNGTKSEGVGSNVIDGCAKVPTWGANAIPIYKKQCHEEAHAIIIELVDKELSNIKNRDIVKRIKKYYQVIHQLELL